jgi:hypothetical protein
VGLKENTLIPPLNDLQRDLRDHAASDIALAEGRLAHLQSLLGFTPHDLARKRRIVRALNEFSEFRSGMEAWK